MAAMVRILDGNTFVVSDERGDIEASPTEPTGLFSFDTRFLSSWVLTVNGGRLNALSTDDLQYFEARFFLVPGTGTVYIDAKLSVIRQRAVGQRLPRGADDPQPHAEAGRPRDPDRRRRRLRRPVRGQGRAQEGRHVPTTVDGRPLRLRLPARDVPARDGDLGLGRPPRSTSTASRSPSRIEPHGTLDDRPRRRHDAGAGLAGAYDRPKYGRGQQARPPEHGAQPREVAGRGAPPRERLGAAQGDLPAEPRRPRRAALLAAGRRGPQPAGGRACRGS